MIDRYNVEAISQIWEEESKFSYYLKTELALLESLEQHFIIPINIVDKIKNVKINIQRIHDIEKTTQHDVIAFCSSITEQLPIEYARFFHFGVTSSDIIDTSHALMIRDSLNIIMEAIKKLKTTLKLIIDLSSDIICLGRSHGINAEPMIMGQKFLSFYAELIRREKDYQNIISELTGKFSGAVGNYTILNTKIEETALNNLNLKTEIVSSQVIPRDHYARLIANGAILSGLFERIATELRLLQHSDVDEVKEGFGEGQKGSSTMPHKKNPISAENIAGLARVIRSHMQPAIENCALWHERDISHSSVERIILPDHFGLIVYSLERLNKLLTGLVFDREKIEAKVKNSFHSFSSLVLHQLILLNSGISRDELYHKVQKCFMVSQSREQLIAELEIELKGLDHQVSTWLNNDQIKDFYLTRFQEVKSRLFAR
jgi:adenylosuccinate lyase